MSYSELIARVQGRYQRSAARWFCRQPLVINPSRPLISFTFDDFPRSALHTGGAILRQYGLRGTYYASFGLMGMEAPTGHIFVAEDVGLLLEQGHELGCHTYHHCHSWNTCTEEFVESVLENGRALKTLFPKALFKAFSYPISPPRRKTKRAIAQSFSSCRGGGHTFNVGTVDLGYLLAYFMERGRDTPEVLKALIDQNREARGWLIFATHDVCEVPTPFGCTPEFFEEIVRYAVCSGAQILPVTEALGKLQTSSLPQAWSDSEGSD